MLTAHILTAGFASPNGGAFLFPLHVHQRRIEDLGIEFRCFTKEAPPVAEYAERGQALYRRHIASEAGYEEFCQRFCDILQGGRNSRPRA